MTAAATEAAAWTLAQIQDRIRAERDAPRLVEHLIRTGAWPVDDAQTATNANSLTECINDVYGGDFTKFLRDIRTVIVQEDIGSHAGLSPQWVHRLFLTSTKHVQFQLTCARGGTPPSDDVAIRNAVRLTINRLLTIDAIRPHCDASTDEMFDADDEKQLNDMAMGTLIGALDILYLLMPPSETCDPSPSICIDDDTKTAPEMLIALKLLLRNWYARLHNASADVRAHHIDFALVRIHPLTGDELQQRSARIVKRLMTIEDASAIDAAIDSCIPIMLRKPNSTAAAAQKATVPDASAPAPSSVDGASDGVVG